MSRWTIEIDGQRRSLTDDQVRHRLRSGDLSGMELASKDGEGEARPLYDQPVFAEEVPHRGSAAGAARDRVAGTLFWHVLAYVAGVLLLVGMGLNSVLPWVAGLWGLFLCVHGLRALPVLWRARQLGPRRSGAVREDDPFLARVSELVEGTAVGEEVVHAARKLQGVRQELAALAAERDALDDEKRRLEEGASRSLSLPHGAVFELEHQAVVERLDLCRRATRALERVESAQRALVHRIESIRLATWQSQGEPAPPPGFLRSQLGDVLFQIELATQLEEPLASALRDR